MKEIADIHCHILPYVDDGATIADESRALVDMQYEQGVRYICCTPHLRRGMFETPDEAIIDQFAKLKERTAESYGDEIKLFLSREYHADACLRAKLESGKVLPLGKGKNLLVEFGSRHSIQDIHHYIKTVQEAGYRPLVAHAERYQVLWQSPDLAEELIELGARIQMNVSSILGREGRMRASYCKKLLKRRLVHVVASDSHDTELRPPELAACAAHLERKYGAAYATELMHTNPINILYPEGENA